MHGAQVAVSRYVPVGLAACTRTIVRRVRVAADDVRIDGRSRRRRTIDPAQLALVLDGDAYYCYAYSFIVTNLTGDARSIEAWFRRADIEERIRDAKWGMALRHLPSGNATVNTVWMRAALLALNLSAWMQALGRLSTSTDGRTANGCAASSSPSPPAVRRPTDRAPRPHHPRRTTPDRLAAPARPTQRRSLTDQPRRRRRGSAPHRPAPRTTEIALPSPAPTTTKPHQRRRDDVMHATKGVPCMNFVSQPRFPTSRRSCRVACGAPVCWRWSGRRWSL